MSEEQQVVEQQETSEKDSTKLTNLVAAWMVSTVIIVFAALTTYIARFTGTTTMDAMKAGFPIWGITALAAAIIFVGYFLYARRKAV